MGIWIRTKAYQSGEHLQNDIEVTRARWFSKLSLWGVTGGELAPWLVHHRLKWGAAGKCRPTVSRTCCCLENLISCPTVELLSSLARMAISLVDNKNNTFPQSLNLVASPLRKSSTDCQESQKIWGTHVLRAWDGSAGLPPSS